MSYFLTATNVRYDLKSLSNNIARDRHLYEKQFPLGWAFFSKGNVEKLLKTLGYPSFDYIQIDMKFIWEIYGDGEDIADLPKLNDLLIRRITSRAEGKVLSRERFSDYARQPLRAKVIRLPKNDQSVIVRQAVSSSQSRHGTRGVEPP